jgi:four helix bundle protein
MFNHERLKCYEYSMVLAKRVPFLVSTWPKGSSYLDDQLKRAMSSVILNIAEGNGRRTVKERRRFFDIARASAAEVASIIDIAFALRYTDRSEFDFFKGYLLQIVKILYKLK